MILSSVFSRPIEILVVEDSPSDASLTIQTLSQSRVATRLTWLEDGETAIAYLQQQGEHVHASRPDLILLDLNLPGMDGRDVLAMVKTDPIFRRIPVVVFTTSSDEQDILYSYNLHANCYITKPFNVNQFLDVLHQIDDFWLAVAHLPPE